MNCNLRIWVLPVFLFVSILSTPVSALEISECKGALEPSVPGDCSGITYEGCCDLMGRVLYCKKNNLYCIDCADGFEYCAWNSSGYYDCGQEDGMVDPLGQFPLQCGGDCSLLCTSESACSGECPGSCGNCDGDAICLEDGTCYTPQCDNKECGLDAMGFVCGICPFGTECVDALGKCMLVPESCLPMDGPGCDGCGCEGCVCDLIPSCCTENWDIMCATVCELECGHDCSPCPEEPSCDGLECGTYCGVTCGECPVQEVCYQFQCCQPACTGKVCGPDGCGGKCGECDGYDKCEDGICIECKPKCKGKACGPDGCGGECGICEGAAQCIDSQCVLESCAGSCNSQSPFECFCDSECDHMGDCCLDVCDVCPDLGFCNSACQGIKGKGCCDGQTLMWCDESEILTSDCLVQGTKCGWSAAQKRYGCKTNGTPDPSGNNPMDCSELCTATCNGKECGSDGCAGSCGDCLGDEVCTAGGTCCTVSCSVDGCGPDGCGGSCGECPDGMNCDGVVCIEGTPSGCVPGDDAGCAGCACEECVGSIDPFCVDEQWDSFCASLCDSECGADCPCIPDCAGKECGDDGCGGACGECDEGLFCTPAGACSSQCFPDCFGKECGDDGCGDDCGECSEGDYCSDTGECLLDCDGIPWEGCCDDNVLKYCDSGVLILKSCENEPDCGWDDDNKWYSCGLEAGSEDPTGIFPLSCEGYCGPKCDSRECGDDKCGGVCGECADEELCVKGACVPDDCGPLTYQGCCDGADTLWWCEGGQPDSLECEGKGPCGWSANDGYYNCGTEGEEESSGDFPKACPPGIGCDPDCKGKVCGADGCGGNCGECSDAEVCKSGICILPPPDEGPDIVGTEDTGTVADDPVSPPGKKSGGCNATPLSSRSSGLLLLLLVGLLLLRSRRRERSVAVAVAVAVVVAGCPSTNTNGPYIPPVQDQLAEVVADVPAVPDEVSLDAEIDLVTADTGPDVIADVPDVPEIIEPDIVETVEEDEVEQPPFNCHDIPSGPFFLEEVPGAIASEDLAFDGKGHLVGSNNKAIFKTDAEGNSKMFSANLDFRAGLAYLPNGWLVVNENHKNRLLTIDPEGGHHVLLEGLKYPNGIAVDLKGYIYVTEENFPRVIRIHPYTGEVWTLTEDVPHPNGIAFNPTYDVLYIGSFGSGWVYSLEIAEDGTPGRLEEWGDMNHTSGLLDGIAVDGCGYVYVCAYVDTDIWRFPPDGKNPVLVLESDEDVTYLPNLRFGAGPGWDNMSLYSPDGWANGAWRINIGVPAPPLPYP
jgi:sugar lactone lactonase YvrE